MKILDCWKSTFPQLPICGPKAVKYVLVYIAGEVDTLYVLGLLRPDTVGNRYVLQDYRVEANL